MPPEIIVTNLKPDITIWDKVNNRFNIFELTVPLDVNISQRNIDKSNKYAHFSTDITHINTTVTAFEISSTGNVSSDNKKSLTSLHKFCKHGIKLSTFIKNISSLSIYSSYHIWLCRNDPVFVTPSYLPAPFQPNPWGELKCRSVNSCESTGLPLISIVNVFSDLFSISDLFSWNLAFASQPCLWS